MGASFIKRVCRNSARWLARRRYQRQLAEGYYERTLPAQDVPFPKPLWQGGATRPVPAVPEALLQHITSRADEIVQSRFRPFFGPLQSENLLPLWFKGIYARSVTQHFARIPIDETVGEDVRHTWELSRLRFVVELAVAAALTPPEARQVYLARLDQLTSHWLHENGYQSGVNWANPREVALRGLNLLLAHYVLHAHLGMEATPQLLDLIRESWRRVMASQSVAPMRPRHHRLAERVFLLYGAAFLRSEQAPLPRGTEIAELEYGLLRVLRALILPDGAVRSDSLLVHRECCDLLAIAKWLDGASGLKRLESAELLGLATRMASFLEAVIEPLSGEIPLIGTVDGTLPVLQYAPFAAAEPSLLFLTSAFGLTAPQRAIRAADVTWLFGLAPRYVARPHPEGLQHFAAFGLLLFDQPRYRAYVKYPTDFCPTVQFDHLHLDVWTYGVNFLCDSGTYSLNPPTRRRVDSLREPIAHNVPYVRQDPLSYSPEPAFAEGLAPACRVREINGDGVRLTLKNGKGQRLIRELRAHPTHLLIKDRVEHAVSWGLSFNGLLQEGRGMMTAQWQHAAEMSFSNVQHFALMDSFRADTYGAHHPIKRLNVEPIDPATPIETLIAFHAQGLG